MNILIKNRNMKNKNKYIEIIYKNFTNLINTEVVHSKQDIQRILNSDNYYGFFLYFKNKLVGYAISEISIIQDGRKVLFLNYLYISSVYRRKGYGKLIMNKVIDYTKNELGINFIILIVEKNKISNINFYKKLGFVNENLFYNLKNFLVLTKYL